MTVTRQDDAPRTDIAPGRTRYLTHTNDLMMVVIDFTDGPGEQPDPPHSHPHEQITYVVAGEVLFFLDSVPHHLHPGDMITVASDVRHSIQLLSAYVRLIDTFNPIRREFLP